MAGAPRWKAYTPGGEYVATVKYPALGTALVGAIGEGTIRDGHGKAAIL